MRIAARIFVCIVAIAVALATVAMTGSWKTAARSLQDYYFGILVTFLVLYTLAMIAITSTSFAESYWLIPVASFLAFPVTTAAYFGYLAVFQHEALFSAIHRIDFLGLVAMTFIAIPSSSLAWVFGALAGMVFIVLSKQFR